MLGAFKRFLLSNLKKYIYSVYVQTRHETAEQFSIKTQKIFCCKRSFKPSEFDEKHVQLKKINKATYYKIYLICKLTNFILFLFRSLIFFHCVLKAKTEDINEINCILSIALLMGAIFCNLNIYQIRNT